MLQSNIIADGRLIEQLTKYLKYFKAAFHNHIILIETIFTDQEQIIMRINKIAICEQVITSYYSKNERLLYEIEITREIWKTVDRFFMRIKEFIDHRFNKTRQISFKSISVWLDSFSQQFKNTFSYINEQIQKNQCSLALIWGKIFETLDYTMIDIIKKLLKINQGLSLTIQNTQDLQKLITKKSKDRSQYKLGFEQKQQTRDYQDAISLIRQRKYLSSKIDNDSYSSHIRNRRATVQPSHTDQTRINFYDSLAKKNYTPTSIECARRISTFEKPLKIAGNMQRYQSIKFIKDLMEIDSSQPQKLGQNMLFNNLIKQNKKNMLIISQYRNKALKKQKKKGNSENKNNLTLIEAGQKRDMDSANSIINKKNRHKRTNTIQIKYRGKKGIHNFSMNESYNQNQFEKKLQPMKLPSIKLLKK